MLDGVKVRTNNESNYSKFLDGILLSIEKNFFSKNFIVSYRTIFEKKGFERRPILSYNFFEDLGAIFKKVVERFCTKMCFKLLNPPIKLL